MKILHAIQTMSPDDGGPPQSVCNLIGAYRVIDGVEAAVLCLDDPQAEFLRNLAVPVYALGKRSSRFGYTPALRSWLEANLDNYDAVVIEGIWSYMGLVIPQVARRKGIPYAVFPHGALDPWFNRRYPLKKLKKQIFWRWQYPALRDARALLFTTEIERDLAATSFSPNQWNSKVIPFGIMPPEGDPEEQRRAWFARIPALLTKEGDMRRYLLFFGRIQEKKGCDLLLDAFAGVAQQAPDLHLVFAGPDSGGLEGRLKQQARTAGLTGRVHWPGMVLGDAKWGALRNCEAFVLSSHTENFGIAVVEALACARAVLISDQVNLWPGVQADGAGLVETDSLEATTRMLRNWLGMSRAEQQAFGARAEQCYRSRYSTIETARALVELFS